MRQILWVLCLIMIMPTSAWAEEPAEPSLEDAMGAFDVGDDTRRLKIKLASQLVVRTDSEDTGDSHETDTVAEVRRLRLRFDGSFLRDTLLLSVQLNTSQRSLELLDLFAEYRFSKALRLRVGQFKVPFTQYRLQSILRLAEIDWSIVSPVFGGERQLGIALHNGYGKAPQWRYALAVYTGDNARRSHGVGVAQTYQQALDNPSSLVNPGPRPTIHPEIFALFGYHSPKMDVRRVSDRQGGAPRISTALSVAWDVKPHAVEDHAFRTALETLFKAHGFSALAVGYVSLTETVERSEIIFAFWGLLTQLAYRLTDHWGISLRHAIVDWQNDLLNDARFSANQLGLDNASSVATLTQQFETTLTATFYAAGNHLKLQLEGSWIHNVESARTQNDYQVRTQLQFSFW